MSAHAQKAVPLLCAYYNISRDREWKRTAPRRGWITINTKGKKTSLINLGCRNVSTCMESGAAHTSQSKQTALVQHTFAPTQSNRECVTTWRMHKYSTEDRSKDNLLKLKENIHVLLCAFQHFNVLHTTEIPTCTTIRVLVLRNETISFDVRMKLVASYINLHDTWRHGSFG